MGKSSGLQVLENFIGLDECGSLLAAIDRYRSCHDVPLIYRPSRGRDLKYQVINGEEIAERLAEVQRVFENILPVVQRLANEQVVPLKNRKVGVNVNITAPGGAYRWHYDRNAVTAVLYLNQVEGGEIEAYPDYRLMWKGAKWSHAQNYLDKALRVCAPIQPFGRKHKIAPKPGLLVMMRGSRCLHSVRPVSGSTDRICIVMAFDSPEAVFPQETGLDTYLYTSMEQADKRDPNYKTAAG